MNDLGEAKQVLGMRIEQKQEEGRILIDQERYIKKILEKFNMSDCNSCSTPMDSNVKLSKLETDKEKMHRVPYQEAIGSLLYLSQVSRPDINYAVNTAAVTITIQDVFIGMQ